MTEGTGSPTPDRSEPTEENAAPAAPNEHPPAGSADPQNAADETPADGGDRAGEAPPAGNVAPESTPEKPAAPTAPADQPATEQATVRMSETPPPTAPSGPASPLGPPPPPPPPPPPGATPPPPTGFPPPPQPPANRSGTKTLVIVAAVLGVVALLACGIGGWLLYQNISMERAHKAGKCISEDGDKAKPVSCSKKDALKIIKRLDDTTDDAKCPTTETTRVFINESDDYVLCLKPA